MDAVVQRLSRFQTGEILAHFGDLSSEDLRLRFGAPAGRSALEKYVNGIDFSNDRVFGIFDRDLKLVSLAHLAVVRDRDFAELGLSVAPGTRRRGHGEALLRRAATHAASLGLHMIYMHCLSENSALMGLARKAGFRIVASMGEADASKQLEETRPESIAMEMVNDRIALVDSVYMHQAKLFRTLAKFPEPAITG
jgi:RimJ/RimL family protein N-acetyltransferase